MISFASAFGTLLATRESLPEQMRDLVEKLRQAEPVQSPLNDKKPPSSEDR
jgi:hypothetical protein